MNIAMMTNNYLPYVGGVPISIDRLARSLRKRGHNVDIYAPSYEGKAKNGRSNIAAPEKGVIRYRSLNIKKDTFRMPYVFDKRIDREFSCRNYDIIHTHHPMLAGYSALHMSRKYNLPLVYTHHTRYEQYLHHVAVLRHLPYGAKAVTNHNRIFTNACDMVFAPSESIRSFLESNGTRPEIKVLPTGLQPSDFHIDRRQAEGIRAAYACGPDSRLFCTVARLEQEKNIPFLLDAFARYKSLTPSAESRLLIIGEGNERSNLELQAMALGLERDIIFPGCIRHEELSNWYAACDAFLFASKSETQGIVLLEAMAVGLPVIALQASGVNDVIIHGQNGFALPDSQEVFAQAMTATLDMSAEALATARQYTADGMAEAAESHYMQVLEERECKYAYDAV